MEAIIRSREDLCSVRISKVSELLMEKEPSIIPFVYKFPLVPPLQYKVFSKEIMKYEYFDEMPKWIQDMIKIAEVVKDYDERFKEYLIAIDMSKKEFKSKNPKTKLDVLYDWLFSEQLDIGILKL